ncbi:MAG: glutathione S-transferase family protein [Rhodospirillaceae bacterium]|nr:glutathione S-transferase family protein [Rhodospirillaceae bacterium]
MLTLYHHPRSTYARRVVIGLLEKQLEYTSVVIDMGKREHRGPAHLAMNPYGRVPVLADDDFVLYESATILRYLEETRPERPLLPSAPRERALTDMHMRLCDIQLARHTGIIIFPKRFLPKERWDTQAMTAASQEIQRHLDILEPQLADRTYLVADQFTLADLAYIPFVHFLPIMDVATPPNVQRWVDHLLARPSARSTVPDV